MTEFQEHQPLYVLEQTADEENKDESNDLIKQVDYSLDGFHSISWANDNLALAKRRYLSYQDTWNECHEYIMSILSDIHSQVLEEIITYVAKPFPSTIPLMNQIGLPSQVPTALVLGSAQTSLTKLLGTSTSESITQNCLFAPISSRSCPTLRTTIHSIYNGFVSCANSKYGIQSTKSSQHQKLSTLLSTDDFERLRIWYSHFVEKQESTHKPYLVIIIQDFEAFDPQVLVDLIHIVSSSIPQLPLRLIFSISTSVNSLYDLLPRATITNLVTNTVYIQDDINTLSNLLQKLFIERNAPLKPSLTVLKHIFHTFETCNNSIDNIVSKLQVMHMAHYFSNPFSIWTSFLNGNLQLDSNYLNNKFVDALLCTPSFQTMIENHIQDDQEVTTHAQNELLTKALQILKLGSNDQSRLESTNEFMQYIAKQHAVFCSRQRFAYQLYKILKESWSTDNDNNPFESPRKNTSNRSNGANSSKLNVNELIRLLNGSICINAQDQCKQLRKARDDLVHDFLSNALEITKLEQQDFIDDNNNDSDNLLPNFENYLTQLKELQHQNTNKNYLTNGNVPTVGLKPTKLDNQFTELISKLSYQLTIYFENSLKSYQELPFHEIWYFDNVIILEGEFHPPVQSKLIQELQDPTETVKLLQQRNNNKKKNNVDDFILPDMCRAYRLFKDAGKLINLSDWYNAFQQNLAIEQRIQTSPNKRTKQNQSPNRRRQKEAQDENDDDDDNNDDEDDVNLETRSAKKRRHAIKYKEIVDDNEEIAARFIQATTELGMLGFIQRTQRKTEHVSRIIW